MSNRPRRRDQLDPALPLSAEEGFVWSRLDGTTTVEDLSAQTGLGVERVSAIVQRLEQLGALQGPSVPHTFRPPGSMPQPPVEAERVPGPAVAPGVAVMRSLAPEPMPGVQPSPSVPPQSSSMESEIDVDALPLPDLGGSAEGASEEAENHAIEVGRGDPADEPVDAAGASTAPPAETEADDDAPVEVAGETSHRALFERELRDLPVDARVALAQTTSGPRLLALCFDPDPQVVRALVTNATAGLDHARLIAANHHNPIGLDAVLGRSDFARDREVARRLLRNNQASQAQLRRILEPRRMRELYVTGSSTDVTDRARAQARDSLRAKFTRSDPQERFDLVWSTEGRVLALLVSAPFDSRTTQLFCARNVNSVLLVQNLAKFRACPPQLLIHLLKQPLVKRQPGLKKLVLSHPNVPSEVRRRGSA